jgi:N-acetylmuramoyl-L-alanine amidase
MTPAADRREFLGRAGLACGLLLNPARAELAAAGASAPVTPPAWDVPRAPLPRVQWADLTVLDEVLIPPDRPWRLPQRRLRPRFVTVHSTGNADGRADAPAHGRLLLNGLRSEDPNSRTGYITWHFTVDATRVVQHLPVSEQGDHADFRGPGNHESLGVEMTSAAGMTPADVLHRTAFLLARLMRQHDIAAARLVPHQHWPRPPDGSRKPCPAELLDAGVPGERWRRFVGLAQAYRKGLRAYRQLPPIA